MFLEISQNSQENTSVRSSFLIKLQACSLRPAILLKKRLSHRCFPMNFVKFLRAPFYRTPLEDCFWLVRLWYIHISGQHLNQRNHSLSFFFLINSCIDRLSLVHWFLYKLFCTALIYNNHRSTYCQNELLMDYQVSKSPSIFIFSQELISKLHSLGKRFKQIFWEFFQRCHLVI